MTLENKPIIVAVGTSKGGAGKSTLCTNLVVQHLDHQPDTALVDADPQKSASMWAACRGNYGRTPDVLAFEKTADDPRNGAGPSGNDFGRQIIRLSEKYPAIFIDVAGRNSSELRASLLISDILVLPLRAATFDAWSFATDIELINFARLQNPDLKVMVVYNGISTNLNAAKSEIADMDNYLLNILKNSNLIIAKTKVYSRSGYVRAVGEGASVTELTGKLTSSSTEKAKSEIRSLYKEIIHHLSQPVGA